MPVLVDDNADDHDEYNQDVKIWQHFVEEQIPVYPLVSVVQAENVDKILLAPSEDVSIFVEFDKWLSDELRPGDVLGQGLTS